MRLRWSLFQVSMLAVFAAAPTNLVAGPSPEVADGIEVLLTTAPSLSHSARETMIAEASAIWSRHGIDIRWQTPTVVRPVAWGRLRALVVQKTFTAENAEQPVPIGELVRPASGHPVALISIGSAQHLMSSMRGRAGYELIAVDDRRLGIVLGRALAHEIGHYLLDTHTHARDGLMRPNFNALEFTDSRSATFVLDRAAAAWLRTRRAEKFAYAQR